MGAGQSRTHKAREREREPILERSGNDTSATRKAGAIRRPERLPNSPKHMRAAATHADKAVEEALAALKKEEKAAQQYLDMVEKKEAAAKAEAAKAEAAAAAAKKRNANAAVKRAAEAKAAAAAKEAKAAAAAAKAAKAAEKALAEGARQAALAKKNWWSDEFQASLSALKRGDPLPKAAPHIPYSWNTTFTPITIANAKSKSATRYAPTKSKLRAEFGMRPRGVKPAVAIPKLRAPPSGRTRKVASKDSSPDLLWFNKPISKKKGVDDTHAFDA